MDYKNIHFNKGGWPDGPDMFYMDSITINHICKNIADIHIRECDCGNQCKCCKYTHTNLNNICEYCGHNMEKCISRTNTYNIMEKILSWPINNHNIQPIDIILSNGFYPSYENMSNVFLYINKGMARTCYAQKRIKKKITYCKSYKSIIDFIKNYDINRILNYPENIIIYRNNITIHKDKLMCLCLIYKYYNKLIVPSSVFKYIILPCMLI